ncbi:MAG: DoxX family protein [Solirubrobacteraceae bacterium]|nr:MAG: DoxX family protein [Solirubrobacterales bacterium]
MAASEPPSSSRPRRPRQALGAFFISSGTLHFTHTRYYVAIMPPYLPAHRELVYISGVAEIAGGAAALSPLRRAARWWLTLLLIAVFPANLHMALHPDQVEGLKLPRWLLWARLPLQPLCIAWVWMATRGTGAAAAATR